LILDEVGVAAKLGGNEAQGLGLGVGLDPACLGAALSGDDGRLFLALGLGQGDLNILLGGLQLVLLL